jgi:hypothetical protein
MPALPPKPNSRAAHAKLLGYPFIACAIGSR